MKKHIFAACLAALTVTPAMAADMATKAPPMGVTRSIYDWTGMYVGINGGGGRSNNCWDMNGALLFGFSPALAEGCNNGTGAVVGGQIGYRYQVNSLVFGIEAQGDWADMKGSNTSTVFNGLSPAIQKALSPVLVNTSKVDAIGMFTGQVGYSFGPLLWYVKGGAAVTDNKYDGALNLTAGQFSLSATDSASAVKFGGVVGTGLDWMFADGWSVGVEYNHLFMGSNDNGFKLTSLAITPGTLPKAPLLAPGMPTRNDSISQDIDMATVRLNYRFTSH